MTRSIINEIAKARPHDTWVHNKLHELGKEYGVLLDDHHRLVRDNSKLRMTINQLRVDIDDLKRTLLD